MRILERMGVMIKADAHGVMDQLEERSLLLEQHLREAELELVAKRARAESLAEEERQLREEAERLGRQVAALDEDVELALAGENEELARFAVRRLLPQREACQALRERIGEVADARGRVAERLSVQERDFEELRRRVRERIGRVRRDESSDPLDDPLVADEEIDLELLRRRGASGRGDE